MSPIYIVDHSNVSIRVYMPRFWICFSLALLLIGQVILPVSSAQSALTPGHVAELTLAGTRVEIDLPFPPGQFIQAAADDAQQVATAVRWEPFFEVSLTADRLPDTGNAGSPQVQQVLRSLRAQQGAEGLTSHQMSFFDQLVGSASTQVVLELRTTQSESVVVHEWVTQHNNLIWTFRVSYAAGSAFDPALLEQVIIRQIGLVAAQASPAPLPGGDTLASGTSNLPTPLWWNGDCDTNYYKANSSGRSAYGLGGSYRGVKACGPRPWSDGAPDVVVRFFTGAWGEYEWECVELSMRYLYLAYAIPPYHANGKDVVANYPGTRLRRVANGAVGQAPVPGDVLSYGPTTTYGHTSVVSASNVDASGNGTIIIVEQNSSAAGTKTLTVSSWVVQASMTVSGWLHEPAEGSTAPYKIYLPRVSTP
jgi:hypothetical protein